LIQEETKKTIKAIEDFVGAMRRNAAAKRERSTSSDVMKPETLPIII
jgi:hypothetical protein